VLDQDPTRFRHLVGQDYRALTTPALLLDRQALERNLAAMAHLLNPRIQLRPHAKTHKCPQVAARQVAHGAIGVTTATVWEAAALAEAGIDDILIANEVIGETKIRHLAETSRQARLTVAVDEPRNATDLSRAATEADSELGVVVDVDIGMGRCGVRTITDAIDLTRTVSTLPGLRFRGVTGYEGHCALEPDRDLRTERTAKALGHLLAAVEGIESAGFEVEIVASGGTGTYDFTGTKDGITEIQAGSYAFMDTAHAAVVQDFEFALTVLSTIISRHGDTLVLDAGKKTLGLESPTPLLAGHHASVQYVAEEHTVVHLNGDSSLQAGDVVKVIPSYCPVTVNLHDVYNVIEEDEVASVWPILARGAGWSSLHENLT
jgi:D-serine deaminase-like pyridoxal phosphate-dependent protein